MQGKEITISILQADLVWENVQANLQNFESKIQSLPAKKQLVFLPEMFTTGFSMQPAAIAEAMDGGTVAWMRKMARSHKIILIGSVIIQEDNQFFNRLIWMQPDGQFFTYDKRHLFSYAGEHEHFTAGTKRLLCSVNGWICNLQICYDLRFPLWARQAQKKESAEYDILCYLANWPATRIAAWRTLLQARAIENQCFVIGVNRVGKDGNNYLYPGHSMLIHPSGEIIYEKADVEDSFTITLQKDALNAFRKQLPFLADRDNFLLLND